MAKAAPKKPLTKKEKYLKEVQDAIQKVQREMGLIQEEALKAVNSIERMDFGYAKDEVRQTESYAFMAKWSVQRVCDELWDMANKMPEEK